MNLPHRLEELFLGRGYGLLTLLLLAHIFGRVRVGVGIRPFQTGRFMKDGPVKASLCPLRNGLRRRALDLTR